MAQYIKYEQRAGGYIIGRKKGAAVTYELTPRGDAIIAMHGVKDGDQVRTTLLNRLRKMGDAYTTAAAAPTVLDPAQIEFPFT